MSADSDSPRKVIITPTEFVDYHRKGRSIPSFNVHPICLFYHVAKCFYKAIAQFNATLNQTRLFNHRQVYSATINGQEVTLAYTGVGSPSAGKILEELIVLGARTFICVGSAGAIQESVVPGTIIIPDRAIIGEGTSPYYSPGSTYSKPDDDLVVLLGRASSELGVHHVTGTTWTTDALFMETVGRFKKLQSEGVLCTEMEASAMFTIGHYRNVTVGSIFYISDGVESLRYIPGSKEPFVANSIDSALGLTPQLAVV